MFKTIKYEIVEVYPKTYSILEHKELFGFKYEYWVKDYQGFRETWYSFEDAENWVKGAIEYRNHKVKTIKVFEVEQKC